MRLMNCTRHTLRIRADDDIIELPPCGLRPATLIRYHAECSMPVATQHVRRWRSEPSDVRGLPPPQQGVAYIVPMAVAIQARLMRRDDLYVTMPPDETGAAQGLFRPY